MSKKLAAALLAAGALLGVSAAPAGAHALVKSSDPARDALLDKAPASVAITFTERPDPALSSIRVLTATGNEVQQGRPRAVPGKPSTLAVALKQIENGVYTVAWRAVSRVDGHVTAGFFAFGVGVSPAGATPPASAKTQETPPPSAAAVAGRWLLYWGLALLVGGASAALFVFERVPKKPLIAAWLMAAAGIIVIMVAEAASVGVSIGVLLRSTTGSGIVNQIVAVVVAGIAVVVAARKVTPATWIAVAATALAAMLTHVLAGHAGGSAHAPLNVSVQFVHLAATGVWIGGLVWLLAGLKSAPDRPAAARRFSFLAGIALAVVALTGALRAIDEVGSFRRLVSTSFGVTVLVKVGLFAGLVALGALNRYRILPATAGNPGPARGFVTSVRAEVLIAAGVLAATGLLATLPPANLVAASAAKKAPPQRVVVVGNDFATTTRVRLTVTPGTAGLNTFEASVTDFDTGAPLDARRVALRFLLPARPEVGSQTVELTHAADALWSARSSAMAIDGSWTVTVVVETADGGLEIQLRVQTRLPPQNVQVSRQSGQPTLYTIALSQGRSVQAYLDPGEKAGKNDVHFTFFDASGNELPVTTATMYATPPGGDQRALEVRRFGPGHFVATVTVTPGRWLFQVQATAKDGSALSAYFTQDVRP
jgi:copper transport protein